LRRFADMHDIGDMLVAAGFADPVMDMEMIIDYAGRASCRRPAPSGVRWLAGRMGWRDWRRVLAGWNRHASLRRPGHAGKARLLRRMAAPSSGSCDEEDAAQELKVAVATRWPWRRS
jgi:hypothetical protein